MKKIFSFLAAALLSISAMAATTFTFSNSVDSQTKDGFTVALAKGEGQSAPAVNTTNAPEVRLYAKNTITITGTGITRVDLTFSKQGQKPYATLAADGGNLAAGGESTSNEDKKTDTWTGSANSVTFTMGETGQRVLYSIVINGDGTTGGGTTGGGTTGGGTTGGSTIVINNDFLMVDAYNFDDEDGKGWSFDFYSDYDEETDYIIGEELYFHFFSSKTASINGTYSIEMGYYFKDDEDEEGVEFTSGTVTIAAKGTKNEYDEPIYQFTATFQAPDGNTYTLNKSFGVYAMNDDGDITLNENGGTTGGGTTGGGTTQEGQTITVAEAIAIGEKLADKAETAETYTVVGYVGKIAKDYDAEKKNQCWFMCDDKSEVGSSAYFNFEAYWCYIDAPVALGDYVSVTGKIKKYGSTIEIQNGQAKKITEPTGVKNAELELKAVKSLENGTLIIRRGEKTYNVLGAQF